MVCTMIDANPENVKNNMDKINFITCISRFKIAKDLNLDYTIIDNFKLSNECYGDIISAYLNGVRIRDDAYAGTILYDMLHSKEFLNVFKQKFCEQYHISNIISGYHNSRDTKLIYADNGRIKSIKLEYTYGSYFQFMEVIFQQMKCPIQIIDNYINNSLFDGKMIESMVDPKSIGVIQTTNNYSLNYEICEFLENIIKPSKLNEYKQKVDQNFVLKNFVECHGGKDFKFISYSHSYLENKHYIWYLDDNNKLVEQEIYWAKGIREIQATGMNRLLNNRLNNSFPYISKSITPQVLQLKIREAALALAENDIHKIQNFYFTDIINYLKNDMDFRIKINKISDYFIFSQTIRKLDIVRAYDAKSDTFYKKSKAFDYINEDIPIFLQDESNNDLLPVIKQNRIFLANCALTMLMQNKAVQSYHIPRNFFKLNDITYVKGQNYIRFQFGLKSMN